MKKTFILGAVALMVLGFTACDDDDDDKVNPMDNYIEALETMYPGASRNATWERKAGYIVADFRNAGNYEVEVWFTPSNALWAMTVTDGGRLADMPQMVQDGFNSGPYSTWTIDDIDYYQRPDLEDFYVIDVEKAGESDQDLYYSPAGELLKVLPDGQEILPTTQIIP